MSEQETLLQQQIAALAAQINKHKQQEQGAPAQSAGVHFSSTPYAYQRGRGRGRGGRFAAASTFRNRSVVVSHTTPTTGSRPDHMDIDVPRSPGGKSEWVRKRDGKSHQLINSSIFPQLNEQRMRDIEQTNHERQRVRDEREKSKLNRLVDPAGTIPAGRRMNTLVNINNVQFKLIHGGDKLVRVSNDPATARSTPKTAVVAGVPYVRSKNGNLYRKNYVRTNKKFQKKKTDELCSKFTMTGSRFPLRSIDWPFARADLLRQGQIPRTSLTASTGTCNKGRDCRYVHDSSKVAICREYLQKGTCGLGDTCDLSHDPTPNRVPHCLHFLRSNCTNEKCRYAHVRVNPAAPVCHAFGTLGYCQKGDSCTERHVFECPDYANTGSCRRKKCRLPHVDRAGQMRRNGKLPTPPSGEQESDISSDEDYDEIDSDDVDSDDLDEDDYVLESRNTHELSQQTDFVQL